MPLAFLGACDSVVATVWAGTVAGFGASEVCAGSGVGSSTGATTGSSVALPVLSSVLLGWQLLFRLLFLARR